MERENIFLIVILRLIFSNQTNLWINLLFLHIEVSLHLTYIPFTVHQYIKSIILSISQKSRTHTYYKTIIKIFNISHSMEKTSSTFGSISKPNLRRGRNSSRRVKVERHCESFSRFSTVAARMKTRSRLFRSFWRPLERGVSLSSTTVDSRFIETSHDIPRRWWQSRSSRNRDYTRAVFCPPRKSSSSQGLAESLALSRSNRPRIRSSCDLWLSSIAIIFDSRYGRYVLR